MKKLLVEQLQGDHGLTEAAANQAVDQVFGALADVLATGEKVTIQNFGTFERKLQQARQGRNPQTGEPIHIAERYATKFKESRKRNR